MEEGVHAIKVAYIGGGSECWASTIIRDIIFKKGLQKTQIDFHLLDIDLERADRVKANLDMHLAKWKVDRVRILSTVDVDEAIADADFVIITISTGRLKTMKNDLEIPEKYGVFHTVGDTSGPAGWSRALRNIPVFKAYAEKIKQLAPDAYVLNYTNPMAPLTKVLADELGRDRVVGLCHGLFECYDVLKAIFGVEEEDIRIRFGGLNHFFWILDIKVKGEDGYKILREKLDGRNFATLIKGIHKDGIGFDSDKWLAGELFEQYGYLPYVGDRHTCEFFNCYLTGKDMMERFKLRRTTVKDREKMYAKLEQKMKRLIAEGNASWMSRRPSRETAADIIKAITLNEGFVDVVNTPNIGQISNLPMGAVVETLGYIDGGGVTPLTVGPMPNQLKALLVPHAEVQIRTVNAALTGDLDEALSALAADPMCAHMTASDVKKMGIELLEANRDYLPQFFSMQ